MSDPRTDETTRERSGFTKLLQLLDPDPERAAIEFNTLKVLLTKYFEWNHCHEAEELFDRMIEQISLRLDEGLVIETNIRAYLKGAARNSLQAWRREKERQKRALDQHKREEGDAPPPTPEDEILEPELEALAEERRRFRKMCFDACRDELLPEQLMILEDYLLTAGDKKSQRERLQEFLKVSEKALMMRVLRIKRNLRDCIEPCLRAYGISLK